MRLEGKIGIVTAAASGMGRAGALRFAREGAAVGVVDIDQAGVDAVVGEITAAGGRAQGLVGDLSNDDFARAIVRRTARPLAGSISCGTMSATPARPRSKASTWPISTSRSDSICVPYC
jgi:NAD(P)-dependent dehydrogenase (short-subunit alcohol dehydrogenase family)